MHNANRPPPTTATAPPPPPPFPHRQPPPTPPPLPSPLKARGVPGDRAGLPGGLLALRLEFAGQEQEAAAEVRAGGGGEFLRLRVVESVRFGEDVAGWPFAIFVCLCCFEEVCGRGREGGCGKGGRDGRAGWSVVLCIPLCFTSLHPSPFCTHSRALGLQQQEKRIEDAITSIREQYEGVLEKKQEEYVEKYRHLQYIEVGGWVGRWVCLEAGG